MKTEGCGERVLRTKYVKSKKAFNMKNLVHLFVFQVILWISWILAVFESDVLMPLGSTDWYLTGFIILTIINTIILMWLWFRLWKPLVYLWHRFGPTRMRKENKTDGD